jgi:uncharacterized protein YcnI
MRSLIFAVVLAAAMPAAAHVSVWPKESVQGAREKYEIRVPNEKQADTVALEIRFPSGLKVSSFEQKPGWNTEPLRDSAGAIVGVRWTGKLPPQQFTEFGLLAANPATGGEIAWSATQVFADGTKVEWSGEPGSKTPAPRVMLKPAAARSR